jgi:chaperonin cofactor prefoldin
MLTKTDLNQITKIIKSSEERLDSKIDKLDKNINRIDGKLDYTINFLDRDYLKLLHRVEMIEEHLHLNPASI